MSLPHGILGFLTYEPMSGYDLKKVFDESLQHFWSATQSHIYKALDQLEADGLVAAQLIAQEGKPDRKEYRITAKGRRELKDWLATPLSLETIRLGWLIQIFFGHELANEDLVELLTARRTAIEARLGELDQAQAAIAAHRDALPEGGQRQAAAWQITLDYGVNHYRSELAWLDKTIHRVADLPG